MTEDEIFEAVFFKFKSLHFGGHGLTPLQDIAATFEALRDAPQEVRQWIDSVVHEFAKIGRAVEMGDFEEVDPMTADDDPPPPRARRVSIESIDDDFPQERFDAPFLSAKKPH